MNRLVFSILVASVMMMSACEDKEVDDDGDDEVVVTSVALSDYELTLIVHSTETLTAIVSPEDATEKEVTWSSGNSAIAIVENGVVTAVGVGETNISATTKSGSVAICRVTVLAELEQITMTTADSGNITIEVSGSKINIIDWGDGTNNEINNIYANNTHSYSGSSSHTITITGHGIVSLYCTGNQLINLDISGSVALVGLWCSNNQLTSLNLSNNVALVYLECVNNQLSSLDLSKNIELKEISCVANQLSSSALNILFGTLHSNAGIKTIKISNNPGTENCNQSIAIAKGWAVFD